MNNTQRLEQLDSAIESFATGPEAFDGSQIATVVARIFIEVARDPLSSEDKVEDVGYLRDRLRAAATYISSMRIRGQLKDPDLVARGYNQMRHDANDLRAVVTGP